MYTCDQLSLPFFFFLFLSPFIINDRDIVTRLSHELIKRSNDKKSCIILLRNVVIAVYIDCFELLFEIFCNMNHFL